MTAQRLSWGLRILLAPLGLMAAGMVRADEPGYRQFPGALLPEEATLSDEDGFSAPLMSSTSCQARG